MSGASQSLQPMVLRLDREDTLQDTPALGGISLGRSLLIALAAGGVLALVPMAVWGIFESGPSLRDIAERAPGAPARSAPRLEVPAPPRSPVPPPPAVFAAAPPEEPATPTSPALAAAPAEVEPSVDSAKRRAEAKRRARRRARREQKRMLRASKEMLAPLATLDLEAPKAEQGPALDKLDLSGDVVAAKPLDALEERDVQRASGTDETQLAPTAEPPAAETIETDSLMRTADAAARAAAQAEQSQEEQSPSAGNEPGWSWAHAHAAGEHWTAVTGIEQDTSNEAAEAAEAAAEAPSEPPPPIEEPVVNRGALDAELAQYARSHNGLLRRCLLGPHDMPVSVIVHLTIEASGQVSNAQVTGTVPNPEAPQCLHTVITRWRLAEQSGRLSATLPLRY